MCSSERMAEIIDLSKHREMADKERRDRVRAEILARAPSYILSWDIWCDEEAVDALPNLDM